MKVCILVPGNILGGGVKLPVRLASHLSRKHDVTLMYPIIKHYTPYHKLLTTSWLSKIRFIIGGLSRYRSNFIFDNELDKNVKLRTYLLVPSEIILKQFDVIIYPSVWQYHELKSFRLDRVRKIHWTLADSLFCSSASTGFPINSILQAYLADDILIAPSQMTAVNLERYGVKVWAVIPGGVDPIFKNQSRSYSMERPTVLGYFQPMWWVKGSATLIQCLRQLRLRYPLVRIELFGHQNCTVAMSGSSVCDGFFSGLSFKEVPELFRRHDIFVYPSYTDGFPSPPLEAMACGCAVVTTRVGAVPEYARHEENALLCDPMDNEGMFNQVERLILDRDLRMRLSYQAPLEASRWSWEECASKFDAVLHEVV